MKIERVILKRMVGVLFLISCCLVRVFSQVNIQIPYSCSFEDPQENSNWVLNSGINPPNDKVSHYDRWYIERATQTDGLYSLFISNDEGMTPGFDVRPNLIVAYREIAMPAGQYEFSFDWKNNASLTKKNSGLYVCLIPSSMFPAPQSTPSSSTIQRWLSFAQNIETEGAPEPTPLKGSLDWKNSSFTQMFNGTGETYYLTFAWLNDERDTLPNSLSACIDNIQITSAACARPENIVVETMCDTIKINWEGICDYYDLEYKSSEQTTWRKIPSLRSTNYTLTGVREGVYDFRIRGICYDTIYSAYAYKNSNLLFCAEEHCLNFVDLKNSAQCYTGLEYGYDREVFPSNPVDFGPDDKRSRHVVNMARNQYDPRTGYALPTIPPGELASVRIGNWDNGSELDRIVYPFEVDCSVASILLMKYAIVLEDPDHDKLNQPHFNLSINDENGNPIDPDCGAASFYANKRASGWHVYYPNYSVDPIVWKDWTTLGINLEPYDGQTISIEITVNDCPPGAHFGYAYFTLGCTAGGIESINCGELEYMTVKAPDGFGYTWFTQYNKITNPDGSVDSVPANIVGTEQELQIPANDRDVYYCRCSFKDDSDPGKSERCYFDLHTVVAPREPMADFQWEWASSDCQNKVKFYNRSHVLTVVDGNIEHTKEPTQSVYWTVNGRMEIVNDFTYTLPPEGGKLDVLLRAGISNDECVDDTIFTVDIPSIICEADTVDSIVCDGTYVQWGATATTKSGYYPDSLVNFAGCDSIRVLNLKVIPPIPDTYIPDTICFGDSVMFNGKWLKESGDYKYWGTSVSGCDSVVVLKLLVRDKVEFDYEVTDVVDVPNSGEIRITNAPEGYTYKLNGVNVAPLTHLAGGYYGLIVYDSVGCPSDSVEILINQDCLEFALAEKPPYTACSGEGSIVLQCEFPAGTPTTYTINYSDLAAAAGFVNSNEKFGDGNEVIIRLPEACRPGHYDAELTVHDIICDDHVIPLRFSVYYADTIVRQKWNDVLAVTNNRYNGGYDFLAYQWYKDGNPLPGEIGPYLYLEADNILDYAAQYHVLLTRSDDGVSVPSCPLTPEPRTDVALYPVPASSVGRSNMPVLIQNVSGQADVLLFNAGGQKVAEGTIDVGHPEVVLPPMPGVYLMVIKSASDCSTHKIIVR